MKQILSIVAIVAMLAGCSTTSKPHNTTSKEWQSLFDSNEWVNVNAGTQEQENEPKAK